MPRTRAQQPPEFPIPDYSNLYWLKFEFNDEKVIRESPILDAFTRYFNEAATLNHEAKELVAKATQKKVPNTPKKKLEATNRVLQEISYFRKINFSDDSSLLSEAEPSPRKPSPKKLAATPHRNVTHVIAFGSSVKASPAKATTPSRTPIAAKKKPIVPKAAIVKEKDPNLIEKLQSKTHKAEELRNEILREKQEQLRRDREEKERLNRERRQKLEEENRKKIEANKLKETKLREFEAKQREEACSAPTTPRKDTKKNKKQVLTPRNAHVPPKKGKDVPEKNDFDISSPTRKHKKPTPPKTPVEVEEVVAEQMEHVEQPEDIPYYEQQENVVENGCEADVEEEEEEEEVLNYIELTEAEIQELGSQKSHHKTRSLSYVVATPSKAHRSSDIISETLKTPKEAVVIDYDDDDDDDDSVVEVSPNEVIEDSQIKASQNSQEKKEVVPKIEPMEEEVVIVEEEEAEANDENVAPVNKSSYDMTMEKVYLPSTETNYNVDDLSSNDETDDESKPRKTVPSWAKRQELNPFVRRMLKVKTVEDMAYYFGPVQQPTMQVLFGIPNTRHRNSSSVWQSPLHQPTAGISRLPNRR